MRHVPEGGGGKSGQDFEGGTVSVAYEGDPTKSVQLTFYPRGMSTINWSKLDQNSESNKASRGKKNTKKILEIPQESFPDNFQVKLPPECQ